MKKTIRLLTVLMILVVLASTVLVSALSSPIGETIAYYDDYGYYAYFDFENYGASSDHLIYMRADTSTNAGGLRCDPYL